MGAACSGQDIPHKILLSGIKGSGKTTLLYYWCLGQLTEPVPTESFNVEMIRAPGGATLLIWDVSDPGRRRQFYHGTEVIVYVFGGKSTADSKMLLNDLKVLLSDRDLRTLPVLLVHNEHNSSESLIQKSEVMKLVAETGHQGQRDYVTVRKDNPQTYSDALSALDDVLQLSRV